MAIRHWNEIGALAAAGLALTGGVPPAEADLTTPEILEQTIAALPSCLDWEFKGVCLWLLCTPGGCSVEESPRVAHYNPDLVVCSYNELGENPWREIRRTLGVAQESAASSLVEGATGFEPDAGHQDRGSEEREQKRNLRFKEADAIGHPLESISSFTDIDSGLLCPSTAEMYLPYFQSAMDAIEWRLNIVERALYPASWTPGLSEVGNWPSNTWGPVHPRIGSIHQPEDPKAGAVIAQRAGDIVTRRGQPHVYTPLSNDISGYRTWAPVPLRPADASTGKWQMHHPRSTSSCMVFGVDDTNGPSWASGVRDATDDEGAQDYAWTLWRYYDCCEREGTFIGVVPAGG